MSFQVVYVNYINIFKQELSIWDVLWLLYRISEVLVLLIRAIINSFAWTYLLENSVL